MGAMQYGSAPQVRWLGVGPTYESILGGQPAQVGAWCDLFIVAGGKIVVRPTTDGTVDGDPLFSRLTGITAQSIYGIIAGGGDDADPETGASVASVVASTSGGAQGLLPTSYTFEVTVLHPDGSLTAAPNGTPVFVTVFGIPA